ncbi:hypothetical protein MyChFU_25140 [Mycobacterium intracellulare subsp. chimaera]
MTRIRKPSKGGLDYQGAAVPTRMNKLGAGGAPGTGSFVWPDPAEESDALARAAQSAERHAFAELRQRQTITSSGDGQPARDDSEKAEIPPRSWKGQR